MNKFNLTFWGEILAGRDPRKVKARFAKLFSIDDPERVEHFFSGDTVILRRNLERKVAAEYYAKLRKLGVEARLVKVDHIPVEKPVAAGETSPEPGATADVARDWEKARQLAELEAQQREAHRAAERKEARLRAEAAATQRKAEQEALKRQRVEAEARRKQEEAIRARQQQEAEAQHLAELEARRQQQAKQAAERKAAREEARRREAEQAARRKAKLDEQKRIAREQAAAEKARKTEEKRKAAEALAKKQALEAEKKRKEEQERKKQAAKEKARREEEKRQAAEALAKQRALEAEKKSKEEQERKKQAAKEKARREEEKRKAAEALAKKQALEAEKKRKEEQERKEQAARDKAERERRQAEEKRRVEEERRAEQAREREQEVQRKLMEEQAIARAAEELSDMAALKPGQSKVTSNLELPRRDSQPPKTKQQAGAPNFYSLHPFRNTSEVRERAATASRKKFTGLVAAAVALAGLMILTGRFLEWEPMPRVYGPTAIAAAPSGALTILAGDRLLLHDRAGVGIESVALTDRGIPGAVRPLTYDTSGGLLLHASPGAAADSLTQLHRCSGDLKNCEPVPVEGRAQALATHPLTGELFLAGAGGLVKLSPEGEPLAETELPLPDEPVMVLDSGLLFINSSQGPAISVYRYENSAFGQQLDEVLLLPPPAVEQEQTQVRDFVRSADAWWALLENPETGTAGLYLFDSDWNYLNEVTPGRDLTRSRLLTWGQKVLLWGDDSATIRRFAGNGHAEADLQSDLLDALIKQRLRGIKLQGLAWASGFSLLMAIAVIGATLGYHQYLRSLVYHSRPTRGAEPLDEHTENIHWIDAATERASSIKRLWLSWGALSAAAVLLCVGLGASLSQLVAVLLALCGPTIALALFERSQPAHIATLGDSLILVDHRQMYHIGSGPRIQYRGPFLLIDDVVVFTGTSALPALCSEQLSATVTPVAKAGARVDRKTVMVKLLDAQHPLARGATVIAGSLLACFIALAAGQFL